jgi:hypothetical protein
MKKSSTLLRTNVCRSLKLNLQRSHFPTNPFFASSSPRHHFFFSLVIFPSSFLLLLPLSFRMNELRTNKQTNKRTNENERTITLPSSQPLLIFWLTMTNIFIFDFRSARTMTTTITKTMMAMKTRPLLYITR